MKIRYLTILFFGLFVLSSCPGMNKVPRYYSIIDTKERALVPGETVNVYCVDTNLSEGEWKAKVRFPYNIIYAMYYDDNVCCMYGMYGVARELKSVSAIESIYEVPINIAINPKLYINNENGLSGTKVIYPATAELSKSEAHIGDEISVTCAKPVFDVATFSKDKMKLLEEINYCPIWVKKRGDMNSWISIPIEDCTADSAYHITFTVPENAVSNQMLVLNEGGFEDRIDPNHPNADELRTKYINFNSTSCEKYAYYASKTELLILDASGDRVD